MPENVLKKQGYTIDENDWFYKITTGPGKPKEGYTFRTSLGLIKNDKPQRKNVTYAGI